jgi:uncharacterized FlaG/YvyC family protein
MLSHKMAKKQKDLEESISEPAKFAKISYHKSFNIPYITSIETLNGHLFLYKK